MVRDDAIAAVADAIRAEIAHPLGSMRLLPESEEELALTILNALDEAGSEVIRRKERPSRE